VNTRPLCIYHGNCADGFTAAWVVRKFYGDGNVDFHAADHGLPPPDCLDRDVIMVDFTYPLTELKSVYIQSRSLLILDHHKTAMETLDALGDWLDDDGEDVHWEYHLEKSGAGITWDFYFKGKGRPALLNHIEDRDLWKFDLEWTKPVNAAVFSYEHTFERWDTLFATDIETLVKEGESIIRKERIDTLALCKNQRYMVIGGFKVPVVNAPYLFASAVGQELLDQNPLTAFTAVYYDRAEGRRFSLRSEQSRLDVAVIAQQYGGGGHRNASGFQVPHGWEGEAA